MRGNRANREANHGMVFCSQATATHTHATHATHARTHARTHACTHTSDGSGRSR